MHTTYITGARVQHLSTLTVSHSEHSRLTIDCMVRGAWPSAFQPRQSRRMPEISAAPRLMYAVACHLLECPQSPSSAQQQHPSESRGQDVRSESSAGATLASSPRRSLIVNVTSSESPTSARQNYAGDGGSSSLRRGGYFGRRAGRETEGSSSTLVSQTPQHVTGTGQEQKEVQYEERCSLWQTASIVGHAWKQTSQCVHVAVARCLPP